MGHRLPPRIVAGLASAVASMAVVLSAAWPLSAVEIFLDGFESASNCAWSSTTNAVAPAIGLGVTSATFAAPPGAIEGSCLGPGGERVFAFTPSVPGTLRVILADAEDNGIYVRDACTGGAELLCVDNGGAGQGEIGVLDLADTATVYLVIDSWNGPSSFDLIVALCGNGLTDLGEVCDGLDLNGNSCLTLGYSGGTLACAPGCQDFDVSGCIP